MPAPFFRSQDDPNTGQPIYPGPMPQTPDYGIGNPFANLTQGAQQQFANQQQQPSMPPPQMPGAPGAAPWDDPNRLPEDHEFGGGDILPPGGPEAHPGFMKFLTDTSPDAAIAGAIAILGVRDPASALKWAIEYKQHKDDMAARAQNLKFQQQEQTARTKMEMEGKRAAKTEAQHRTRVEKAVATLRSVGGTFDDFLAQGGQMPAEGLGDDENESRVSALESYVNTKNAEVKEKDRAAKQQKDTFKQQNQVLGNAYKGQTIGKTPWDDDENFAAQKKAAMEQGATWKANEDAIKAARLEIAKSELELKQAEAAAKKRNPNGTASTKYAQAKLEQNEAYKQWQDTAADIDRLRKSQADSLDTVEYGEMLDQKMRDLPLLQQKYELARDKARAVASGGEMPKEPEPKGASDKARQGFSRVYRNAANDEVRKMLVSNWEAQYDEPAPIPQGQ